MCKRLLPLIPAGLSVVQVLPHPECLTIIAQPRTRTAVCVSCGYASERVHSVYQRCLCDLPWQGRVVQVHVRVRRFRCMNPCCCRCTFAEPLIGIAGRWARRTDRLAETQRSVALATGGEPGARLAHRLAIPVSPDTLLRLILRTPVPPRPAPAVLGLDDWAYRKGHRYGTILVDLAQNQVVDLLPDRQASTVSDWLQAHPGVAIIARDRAGAYADGCRDGAPHAVQVADRWHLLCNVGDALRHAIEPHQGLITRIFHELAAAPAAPPVPEPRPEPQPTVLERRRTAARMARQDLFDEATRMAAAGVSIGRIAKILGKDPRTVHRWLRTGHPPWHHRRPRGSILAPYRAYLERRFGEGCRNAAQLWRELWEQGFRGQPSLVRVWIGRWKKADPNCASEGRSAAPASKAPSMDALARMLTRDPAALAEGERQLCQRLLEVVPGLAAAAPAAQRLVRVLQRESTEPLRDVLDTMKATLLDRLGQSLERDVAAVQAALETPWTTSPIEGQINRLKLIKRAMYGRAGFMLLRQRVLETI
jgi:transposase